jgi:hypothetical protein
MCLNETYSKIRIGIIVSDTFPTKTIKEKTGTLLESRNKSRKVKLYDHVSSSELRTEPEYKDS